MNSLGVFGGTFDPIHVGHVAIARAVLQRFDLDSMLFMVSKQPPHKVVRHISDAYHRYAMVELALLNETGLYSSSLELQRGGSSYTVDTLDQLKALWPNTRLCFVAGSDSLKEIHLWKDCGKLFGNNCLIFVQRPGAEVDLDQLQLAPEFRNLIEVVRQETVAEIRPGSSYLVNLDAPSVSSTEIRQLIAAGKAPPSTHLLSSIYTYIQKYRLYEQDQTRIKKDC